MPPNSENKMDQERQIDVRECYSEDFRRKAAKVYFENESLDSQIEVLGPEVVEEDVLKNWLGSYYVFATWRQYLGEIGGTMPQHPQNTRRIIALAQASLNKVGMGFCALDRYRQTNDQAHLNAIREFTERELRGIGEKQIVDGTSNIAHYDFISKVTQGSATELFPLSQTMFFASKGIRSLCLKSLSSDTMYSLNTPLNPGLSEKLDKVHYSEFKERSRIARESDKLLYCEPFLIGVSVTCRSDKTSIRPMITHKTYESLREFFKPYESSVRNSLLRYIGFSFPDGSFSMENGVFD